MTTIHCPHCGVRLTENQVRNLELHGDYDEETVTCNACYGEFVVQLRLVETYVTRATNVENMND